MAADRLFVKQVNPEVGVDGDSPFFYGNRDHAQHVNTREGLVDIWTRDGRVFTSSEPTIGTTQGMSANGTAPTLTAPSLRYTIPAGLTVVPIHVQLKVATVIAKDDIFVVLISDTDTYTSGGTAMMAARNALVESNGALRASQVTNLLSSNSALVEAALTRPRAVKELKREGQTAEVDTTWNPEYNILKGDAMFYITGPASFLVYEVQETTLAAATWTMSWAELPTSLVSHI